MVEEWKPSSIESDRDEIDLATEEVGCCSPVCLWCYLDWCSKRQKEGEKNGG